MAFLVSSVCGLFLVNVARTSDQSLLDYVPELRHNDFSHFRHLWVGSPKSFRLYNGQYSDIGIIMQNGIDRSLYDLHWIQQFAQKNESYPLGIIKTWINVKMPKYQMHLFNDPHSQKLQWVLANHHDILRQGISNYGDFPNVSYSGMPKISFVKRIFIDKEFILTIKPFELKQRAAWDSALLTEVHDYKDHHESLNHQIEELQHEHSLINTRAELLEAQNEQKQDIINNLTARNSLLMLENRRLQNIIDQRSTWPDWIWFCMIAGLLIITIGVFRIFLCCRSEKQTTPREYGSATDRDVRPRFISEGISSFTAKPPLKLKSLNDWKSNKITQGQDDSDSVPKKKLTDELWEDGDGDGIETTSTNTIAETLKDETKRESNNEGYLKHMTSII